MKIYQYFLISQITVAILAGCAAPTNASLTDAHTRYDSARVNPEVTNLAALELKEAGDSLSRADSALNEGESTDTVNHLAYIANQQVKIAQLTAQRKTSEQAVTDAGTSRDQIRLEARTAEADAAKQQVEIVQQTADWQAEDLAAANANANAKSDQALIANQEKQLKALKAKKTERGMVITLGDVLFNTNKAQMKSGGTRNIQKLADFLKQYPQRKLLIEGYTDSTGNNGHNQKLSENRASAVQKALVDMGIDSNRVTTRGYGEAFPVASNDTASNRQLNRRVEIIISDDNGKIAPR